MLTLVIGDFHIPTRASDIPLKFHKLLCPSPTYPSNPKISQVLCLGNITNDLATLKTVFEISPNFQLVRGEFDDINLLTQQLHHLKQEHHIESSDDIPHYKIVKIDNFKIGFTNGFLTVPKNDPSSLGTLARELDVDILVFGGTHKVEAFVLDGKFFVNPGSVSGAFSFDWENESGEEGDEEEEQEDGELEEDVGGAGEAEEVDKAEEGDKKEAEEAEEKEEETTDQQQTTEQEKDEEIKKKLENTHLDDLSPEELSKLNDLTNIPSFCLLETNESACTLYIYTYLDDEVKVDKVTYEK